MFRDMPADKVKQLITEFLAHITQQGRNGPGCAAAAPPQSSCASPPPAPPPWVGQGNACPVPPLPTWVQGPCASPPPSLPPWVGQGNACPAQPLPTWAKGPPASSNSVWPHPTQQVLSPPQVHGPGSSQQQVPGAPQCRCTHHSPDFPILQTELWPPAENMVRSDNGLERMFQSLESTIFQEDLLGCTNAWEKVFPLWREKKFFFNWCTANRARCVHVGCTVCGANVVIRYPKNDEASWNTSREEFLKFLEVRDVAHLQPTR